ncbi:hypothetical protein BKA80DRAFT_21063 [Phyllosticta citrichinensis]
MGVSSIEAEQSRAEREMRVPSHFPRAGAAAYVVGAYIDGHFQVLWASESAAACCHAFEASRLFSHLLCPCRRHLSVCLRYLRNSAFFVSFDGGLLATPACLMPSAGRVVWRMCPFQNQTMATTASSSAFKSLPHLQIHNSAALPTASGKRSLYAPCCTHCFPAAIWQTRHTA